MLSLEIDECIDYSLFCKLSTQYTKRTKNYEFSKLEEIIRKTNSILNVRNTRIDNLQRNCFL